MVPKAGSKVGLEELREDGWYREGQLPWSKTTLWRMRKDGLASIRVAGSRLYRGGAILAWLRAQEGK